MTRRDAPPTEADNAIDRLVADGIIERVDDCVRDEMKEKDDSVHFQQKRIFQTMDDHSKLPDFNIAVEKLNARMLYDLEYYRDHGGKTKEKMDKKKEKLIKDYQRRYKILKKMFTDAQNGLVSPETIRVFLQKDIMGLDTSETIHQVYEYIENRKRNTGYTDNSKYNEPMSFTLADFRFLSKIC